MQEVDSFGETYTAHGCKPVQAKISAITEMPLPTCKKQVQSFIGMINYFSKFSAKSGSSPKIKYPLTGDQSIKMTLQ